MKHHCYQVLLLCVFNRLLQISEMSGLEMRRMCLQHTVLRPANHRKNYRFITPLIWVQRNVMTKGHLKWYIFYYPYSRRAHKTHFTELPLMLSAHAGSNNSPMAHPTPPKADSLEETLQYDTTFEKLG